METIIEYDDYCDIVDETVELAEQIFSKYTELGNHEGPISMVEALINSLEVDKLKEYKEAYTEHLNFLENDDDE